jgi:cytochrome c oxidase subunit 2
VIPRASVVAAIALLAAGCRGALDQSVLEPGGPRAETIARFWWMALGVATAVYVATVGALLWAVRRSRRRLREGDRSIEGHERRMTLAVAGATGVTVIILLLYFGYDLAVGRTLRSPVERQHLFVAVTGHQWWWEVEYPDTAASRWITDANELHIPVGRPVLVELTARDVIHSLWIPNLGGKKDLIPRYKDTLWFQADTPGVYRAQCAEFCGHQHAKMALHVVAHDSAGFEAWRQRSLALAAVPLDSVSRRGQEIFLSGPCAMCHAIAGTPAGSRVGPDLTHLASRRTIAAGTLPNTRGNLAAWIVDPQRIKPGVNMPSIAIPAKDLDALLAYLGTLK